MAGRGNPGLVPDPGRFMRYVHSDTGYWTTQDSDRLAAAIQEFVVTPEAAWAYRGFAAGTYTRSGEDWEHDWVVTSEGFRPSSYSAAGNDTLDEALQEARLAMNMWLQRAPDNRT